VRIVAAALVGVLSMAAPSLARAQQGGVQPPAVADPTISPFELQQLFDSWALLQAQGFLKMSDEQFARFLPRFKALQDTRRRGLQQRTRVLNQLRKAVNDGEPDEQQLKTSIKLLQEIDDKVDVDTRKAYEAVDSVLDVMQQAKFRLFEEQMERRKLELVTRARQANRANNPNRGR
jgi:hypothetical protein